MEGPIPREETPRSNTAPSDTVKLLHLVLLSTSWGMQVWVTFVAGFVMGSHLPRHTYGSIQRQLFPYYFHIGSACAFLNLTLFAMYHPSELLSEEQTTQIIIFFVCVAASVLNAQWFGPISSDIAVDMHLMERSHGLGQEVGVSGSESCRQLCASKPSYRQLCASKPSYRQLCASKPSYRQLCASKPSYRQLWQQLTLYRALSSLCNLCCIACNGFSLYFLATQLPAL